MKKSDRDSASDSTSPTRRRTRARGNGEGSLFKRDKGRGNKGPWYLSWFDERGKRREECAKTTDRATAQRMLAKRTEEVAKRRDGIISPSESMIVDAARTAIEKHIGEYIAACKLAGQAEAFVISKDKQLRAIVAEARITRLTDLTPAVLTQHLTGLQRKGKSARWNNYVRAAAIAFGNWCVKTRKMPENLMKVVSKADEDGDRRRVRRALTDEELARLLEVAAKRGRRAWYLTAALAGLRFGDLGRLQWSDVDFEASTILIRRGKSKRDDLLPLHPDLATELRALKAKQKASDADRVFPTIMDGRTRLNDFFAAGLAERVEVKNPDGSTKMRSHGKGRGKRQVPVIRLVAKPDAKGRVVDLHALRTTLGTKLARAGVAPALAKQIMRHSDYRTTLKYYTDLDATDANAAIARTFVPSAETGQKDAATAVPATATTAVQTAVDAAATIQPSATRCDLVRLEDLAPSTPNRKNRSVKPSDSTVPCDSILLDAGQRAKGVEPSTFSLEG